MTRLKNNILLFKVENQYEIAGLGLILTPGLGVNIKFVVTGTKIKLVRPDKSELIATIDGITFQGSHDILISSEFSKADVPIGTEVWTQD
jgi:hypothetical protein